MKIDFRSIGKEAYGVPLDGGYEMDVLTAWAGGTTYNVYPPLGKRFADTGIHARCGMITAAEVREVLGWELETCADFFGTPDECEDTTVCTGEE